MQGFEIAVTLKGKNLGEVLAQAQALIDSDASTAVATATTGKRGKKAAAAEELDESLIEGGEENGEVVADETGGEEEQLGFDMAEEEPPPKTTKKKLTDKDVNQAAMAHAKKHGRPVTLKLLAKNFKVKSILELKPEQYPKVIAALKV